MASEYDVLLAEPPADQKSPYDTLLAQPAPAQAPIIPRSGAQMEDLDAREFMRTSPDQVRGTGDQPIIPIPRIPQQQGILAQLGAGAVNAASGVVEMAETPQVIASLPIAPAKLTQAIFGGQALSDIKNAYEEAAKPETTIQKGLELGGRALTDAIFGVGMVHGAVGDIGAPKLTESIFGKEAQPAEPEAPPQAVKDEPQATPARPEATAVEPAAGQPVVPESKGFVEAFSTAKGAVSDSYIDHIWDKVQKNEPIQRIAPLENSLREAQKAGTLTSREDVARIVKGEPQEQVADSTEGEAPMALGNTKEVMPTSETPTTRSEVTQEGQAAPPGKPPVQTGDEIPPEIPNPVRGSGKFRQSYQVDKELGDRMESIGASKESGALRSEIASRRLLDELTPEQESDLGKYLVSQRLKTVNPEHTQVLPPGETFRIESDPTISKALDTYKNEIKPEIESFRKQAGLSEEAAAGKGEEFISLLRKPVPETTGGSVSQASKLSRKTRFAQKAEGQAQEYDTDLRSVLEHSYTEVTRKARVAEFYKSVQRKGLAEPSTVYTANGPRSAVTFNDLPPELQHDLRAATEQELQPTGIAKALRTSQRFTTGIALTANPAELLNHMRRQLNLVAAKPPIGRGLLPRLEAVLPYIGPKVGTFARTITDNMSKPENMAVLQDIFDAGGGSSRSFSSMYKSSIPGIRQLQSKTHDLLFGIPKGNGINGWDLRMRVQLEKIRRSAEGNTDPQRIREFANQIGQYGSHPDWIVRGLRTVNPYAATTLPMRLTELKTAVGKSDLQAGGGGKVGRTAETLLRGTGGTLLGLTSANYLLSGKWPWENDKGHEFDLNTGLKGEDGKSIYMKFRVVAPELARPVATAALPNLSREGEAKQPQYLSAFLTGLANQGLSLVSGPAQNALLTALAGKAPYITKAPGARPEVMDVAKTEKGGNRGLEQIKHAAAAVNPLGTALVEEPYHTGVTGPLKYVEQPVPGVRPLGSVFTKAYEKKTGKPRKEKKVTGEDTTPLNP